ncbi:MAG: S8 family serine peptidase [Gammaproteobacteria bacterium]|nr:S8 family serine peptidase [Gammaproteobacteria bacterium]
MYKQIPLLSKAKTVLNPHYSTKILLAFALPALMATPTYSIAQSDWAVGEILVKGNPGISDETLALILQKAGAAALEKLPFIGVHRVNVPANKEEVFANAVSNIPGIAYAELNRLLPLAEFIPDDPKFSVQWHHQHVHTPFAWDIATGSNVVVAVLDTGVQVDHPDLAGNLLSGFNTADDSTNTIDVVGHGTKVAGVIGAIAGNSIGVVGMAFNASILPVRVTNDSTGNAYLSDIAQGIAWAANNGAKVINISYGVSGSKTVDDAALAFRDLGGVVFVSAGNSGTDLGYSDQQGLIAVSASDSNDNITSWSSFGNYVDLIAPGLGIWTTATGGSYGAPSGTSFSSPVVAGIAALLISVNPTLTAAQVEQILEDSATDLGTTGWDSRYGHGLVNAQAAVQAALNMEGQTPTPTTPTPTEPLPADTESPQVSIVSPGDGIVVSGTVQIEIRASDNFAVSMISCYVDNNLMGTAADTESFTCNWNTRKATAGLHTLRAVARDAAGNEGAIQINVETSDTTSSGKGNGRKR